MILQTLINGHFISLTVELFHFICLFQFKFRRKLKHSERLMLLSDMDENLA